MILTGMRWISFRIFPVLFFLLFTLPPLSEASTPKIFSLSIKDHRFHPDLINAQKNQPFTIHVTNNDDHPEEFESYDLEFEIIILPHRSIDVPIRPLPSGSYEFFGDFHPRTAKGLIKIAP